MQNYNKKRKSVLHLAAHIGGGVGTVLSNYFKKSKEASNYTHKVFIFGYADSRAIEAQKDIGFEIKEKMADKHTEVIKEIIEADIVLIHWWNHPLIYDFLIRNKLPNCRIIIWSHVSGLHPPQVFNSKILDYPDIFVFTTPISLETPEVLNLSSHRKKNVRTILATCGTDHLSNTNPKKHDLFNIGYIGTVDYAKIHPDFLKICKKIKIPDAKFIVCGGSYEKEMEQESIKLGVGDRFSFTGRIDNVLDYYSIFDVFGYPLSPNHYGACDQALIESMATGVVPVVMDNKMEKFMIKNLETGIVAKNAKQYIDAIELLYKKPKLREELSQNAKRYANDIFSIDKATNNWNSIFDEVMSLPKKKRKWHILTDKIDPKDIFLESLGNYGDIFKTHHNANEKHEITGAEQNIRKLGDLSNWRSETKGTVHNYLSYFPKDRYLQLWSKLIRNNMIH